MPRPKQPPRLWKRPARDGRPASWLILDNGRQISTGCSEGDVAGAEAAFRDYLRKKHDAAQAIRNRGPDDIEIGDALSLYWTNHVNKPGKELSRPDAIRVRLEKLNEFFGAFKLDKIDGPIQRRYADERAATIADDEDKLPHECFSAPRRELEDLSAAINFALKEAGGATRVFRPTLPDNVDPRTRWLSRSEVAALVRAAWRLRGENGHHTGKHVARFILATVYTGSRPGDICNAAIMPTIGRGYINLDSGIFQRKPANKRETNKRQPTIPVPPRMLAHMRRWQRLGISKRHVIEFHGKPVKSLKTVWPSIVKAAGLATDDSREKVLRHTLRHTAISWMLRAGVSIDQVSDYCGVSVHIIKSVYKHHLPGHFDEVTSAARRFGRTDRQ